MEDFCGAELMTLHGPWRAWARKGHKGSGAARRATSLTVEEQIDQQCRQAIEDFNLLLAQKLDFGLHVELLPGGCYSWHEGSPAVTFMIDGHSFMLSQTDNSCHLLLEAAGQWLLLGDLSIDASRFEDRLLIALCETLDPVAQ